MNRISFIVPCFNEECNVDAFYEEFSEVFSQAQEPWELIFVDDGSSDGTFLRLKALAAEDSRITAIRFSRNFGKEAALWAGLNSASGDIVGFIDADLQQSPKDALKMVQLLEENDQYDCVAAYQEERRGGRALAKIKSAFYRVLTRLSGMKVVNDASDFRVFRRNMAEAILSLPEYFRFSKGIFAWVGFETLPYPYRPSERAAGKSKWSFFDLLKYAIEGMLAFTVTPLRVATVLGCIASFCAVVYFIALLIRTLAFGIDVPGYATLMGIILLLGGAQLLVAGIMGEYLARTYIQGKNRPIFIEKERIPNGPDRTVIQ